MAQAPPPQRLLKWPRRGQFSNAGGGARGMAPGGAAVGSAAHVLGGCLGWAAPGRELRGLLRASAALFCLDEAEGLLGVGAGGREGGQACSQREGLGKGGGVGPNPAADIGGG